MTHFQREITRQLPAHMLILRKNKKRLSQNKSHDMKPEDYTKAVELGPRSAKNACRIVFTVVFFFF